MVAVFALACGDDSNSGAGAVPVGQGGQTGQVDKRAAIKR